MIEVICVICDKRFEAVEIIQTNSDAIPYYNMCDDCIRDSDLTKKLYHKIRGSDTTTREMDE